MTDKMKTEKIDYGVIKEPDEMFVEKKFFTDELVRAEELVNGWEMLGNQKREKINFFECEDFTKLVVGTYELIKKYEYVESVPKYVLEVVISINDFIHTVWIRDEDGNKFDIGCVWNEEASRGDKGLYEAAYIAKALVEYATKEYSQKEEHYLKVEVEGSTAIVDIEGFDLNFISVVFGLQEDNFNFTMIQIDFNLPGKKGGVNGGLRLKSREDK